MLDIIGGSTSHHSTLYNTPTVLLLVVDRKSVLGKIGYISIHPLIIYKQTSAYHLYWLTKYSWNTFQVTSSVHRITHMCKMFVSLHVGLFCVKITQFPSHQLLCIFIMVTSWPTCVSIPTIIQTAARGCFAHCTDPLQTSYDVSQFESSKKCIVTSCYVGKRSCQNKEGPFVAKKDLLWHCDYQLTNSVFLLVILIYGYINGQYYVIMVIRWATLCLVARL